MKAKIEVFSKFIIFKNLVEKQLGKPIKKFRSDGGTEYVCKLFTEYFAEHGIKQEKSLEKLRCLQFDAKMTKGF